MTTPRSRSTSRIGGAPKSRLYSRLKCERRCSPRGSRRSRRRPLPEHQAAGFLQPQLLLELQRAHRGDFLEVLVEARDAHPELAASSSMRSGRSKSRRSRATALTMWWAAPPRTAMCRSRSPCSPPRGGRRSPASPAARASGRRRGIEEATSRVTASTGPRPRAHGDAGTADWFGGAGYPASTMTEPTRTESSPSMRLRYGRSVDASVIRLATGSAAVAMR